MSSAAQAAHGTVRDDRFGAVHGVDADGVLAGLADNETVGAATSEDHASQPLAQLLRAICCQMQLVVETNFISILKFSSQ